MSIENRIKAPMQLLSTSPCSSGLNAMIGSTGVGMTTLLIQVVSDLIIGVKQPSDATETNKIVMLNVDGERDIHRRIRNAIALRMFVVTPEGEQVFESSFNEKCLPASLLRSAETMVMRHLSILSIEPNKTRQRVSTLKRLEEQLATQNANEKSVTKAICIDDFDTYCRQVQAIGVAGYKDHELLARRIKECLQILKYLSETLGCSVWFSHHRKGKFGRDLASKRPSLTDTSDWRFVHEHVNAMFSMGNLSEHQRLRLDRLKPNDAEEASLVVEQIGGVGFASVSEEDRQAFYRSHPLEKKLIIDQASRDIIEEGIRRDAEVKRLVPGNRREPRRKIDIGREEQSQ